MDLCGIDQYFISNEEFDNLPLMAFESYLLVPWQTKMEIACKHPMEIPLCIGGAMVVFREKHTKEMKTEESFLEQPEPPEDEIRLTANTLLRACESYQDCRDVLSDKSAAWIFQTIIDILKRIETPLFVLTERTVRLISKMTLLEPVHPYDFTIAHVLYRESMGFCTDTESSKGIDKPGSAEPDNISEMLQKFYSCGFVTRQQRARLMNILNKRLFHDLHLIHDRMRRNTIRFIMRNMINIQRLYVIKNVCSLRKQRNETWQLNSITTLPHVSEFSMRRIAEKMAPFLFKWPLRTCLQEDLAIRTMVNILISSTDTVWMPGKDLSSVLVTTKPSTCHSGCICGQGGECSLPCTSLAKKNMF